MGQSVLEMAKDLVMAQVQAGRLPPEDMLNALQMTHASLMALKTQEATGGTRTVPVTETVPTPVNWKQSISKRTVACLECGAHFKQLSVKHLRQHGLDARSYRVKYGIPRTQPLSGKDTTARRKQIAQQIRPWEKAPTYLKSQQGKTTKGPAAKKRGTRTRAAATSD